MKMILGIDFGSKRIGLAVTDGLGITAQGLETLQRTDIDSDIAYIDDLVRKRRVDEIVVGRPLKLDGSSGTAADEAGEFADLLRDKLGIPVCLWDERLSTAQADKMMIGANVSRRKRKGARDRIAAQLILQSYMDAQGRGRGA